jgi:hypothetical protein
VEHLVAVAQLFGHHAHHPVAILIVHRALERAECCWIEPNSVEPGRG